MKSARQTGREPADTSPYLRQLASMAFTPDEIRRFRAPSYLWGFGFIAVDGAAYLLCLYGAVVSSFWVSQLLWSIAAGFCAAGLVIIGHDAAHNSLTPSRLLNRILGTLAFLPLLHNYSLWRYSHNFQHHLFTNQRGKDFVWEPLSPSEYRELGPWARARYRFFRSGLGHLFYYIFELWLRRRIVPTTNNVDRPRRENWIDFGIVAAWAVALASGLIWLRTKHLGVPYFSFEYWVHPLVMGIVVPFFVGNMLQSHSDYVQHTHPAVHWYSSADVAGERFEDVQTKVTVHVQHAPPVDWFLHWIQDHTAHHLQPSIPLYRLKNAQAVIDDRHDGVVVKYHYTPRAVSRIIRACKLYDHEAGTWTDFAGNPTSPSCRSVIRDDDSTSPAVEVDTMNEVVAMASEGVGGD